MSWGRRYRLREGARLEPHPARPGQARWVLGDVAVSLPAPVAELLQGLDGRPLRAVAGRMVHPEALRGVVEAMAREGLVEDLGPEPLLVGAGLRHQCHGSGMCCQGHFIGPLDPDFLARVERVHAAVVAERPALAGVAPVITRRVGDRAVPGLALGEDGACLYRDEAGCSVHRILGAEAKPDGCRLFPLDLVATEEGVRAVVSPSCTRAHRSRDEAPRDFTAITGLSAETLPMPPVRGPVAGESELLAALDAAGPGEGLARALTWLFGVGAPSPAQLAARLPARALGQELLADHGRLWALGRQGGPLNRQLQLARVLAFGPLEPRAPSVGRDDWATQLLRARVLTREHAPLGGPDGTVRWSIAAALLAHAACPGEDVDDPFGEALALLHRMASACPAVLRLTRSSAWSAH